mgnify:CR=1 FL=1
MVSSFVGTMSCTGLLKCLSLPNMQGLELLVGILTVFFAANSLLSVIIVLTGNLFAVSGNGAGKMILLCSTGLAAAVFLGRLTGVQISALWLTPFWLAGELVLYFGTRFVRNRRCANGREV